MSLRSFASRLPANADAEQSLRRALLEALRSHDGEPSSLSLDDDPAVCFAPPAPSSPNEGSTAADRGDEDLLRRHGWEM